MAMLTIFRPRALKKVSDVPVVDPASRGLKFDKAAILLVLAETGLRMAVLSLRSIPAS